MEKFCIHQLICTSAILFKILKLFKSINEPFHLQVIGENEVSVPTHLYKVIVANQGDDVFTGSFVVPNKPIDYSHHLKEFQVSMDFLEKKVGVKFYTNLNR